LSGAAQAAAVFRISFFLTRRVPMQSNLSPYSVQGQSTLFPGLAAGFSPVSPAPFGQPGVYGANAYGNNAFGGNAPGQGFSNPFAQGSYGQNVLNGLGQGALFQNPYLQALAQNPYVQNPHLPNAYGAMPGDVQQIISTLGQLAQQITVQSALTQQIAVTLHQIAQLAAQSLQNRLGGLGAGQPFGIGQPFGAVQPLGIGQTLGAVQPFGLGQYGQQYGFGGQYGGLGGSWGGSRPQTIQ
jgi:hypothetical protein